MSEIIRVENLSYIYNQGMPDETKALDDVSFTVEEGDFVGIIGSTGSGKSTLISHFNGLNRPTSGRVLVDGRDLWEQGADLRSFRFLVGLVMQYPEYQLFEETCARDIAYGPRNMGLDEEEVQRRVREAAAFVGLSDELLQKSPFLPAPGSVCIPAAPCGPDSPICIFTAIWALPPGLWRRPQNIKSKKRMISNDFGGSVRRHPGG